MGDNETLTRYCERARAAGTEVEMIAAADLPGRLTNLLGPLKEGQSGIAALPANGWPAELRATVGKALAAAGFRMASDPPGERKQIAEAEIGISFCPVFLAGTGSLVVEAGPGFATLPTLLPEVHVALSYAEGCLSGLGDYLAGKGGALPSRFTLVTGPSRTGDIEATMTKGVHGPARVVHLILS